MIGLYSWIGSYSIGWPDNVILGIIIHFSDIAPSSSTGAPRRNEFLFRIAFDLNTGESMATLFRARFV